MDGIRYWIETEGTGHWFFLAFPVILICLFIWFKGRRVRFLIPSLIISLVIVNPLFYKKWDELGLYAYWRILWAVPVIPVVAGLAPSITERISKTWIKAVVTTAGVGLIALGGTFLYGGIGGSFVEAANAAKFPDYVVQVADRLLELDEHPRVVAQDPIGVYLRQYTGEIDQLFGRDLYGYVTAMSHDAKIIYEDLNNGNMLPVAQYMIDDGYDYLVFSGETGENFELVDSVAGYGIYRAVGTPTVIKERDELGRIVSVTTIDETGRKINNSNGFATTSYSYDDYRRIIEVRYSDMNDKLTNRSDSLYALKKIEWDSNDQIIGEQYFDEYSKSVKSANGYASWKRMQNHDGTEVHLYDETGNEVYIGNENLAKDVWFDYEGWSAWMTPPTNSINYQFRIGQTGLDTDRSEGDVYTCQIEIEFSDVTVVEGEEFFFRTQGPVDGAWSIGNPWMNIVYLTESPKDGVYQFTGSVILNKDMAEADSFEIGFRCDGWNSGSFRVRNVKIEKGKLPTPWTPGL